MGKHAMSSAMKLGRSADADSPFSASLQTTSSIAQKPVEKNSPTHTGGSKPGVNFRGYTKTDCNERLRAVEKQTKTSLKTLASFWEPENIDTTILRGNIEMPIGLSKIPTAAVGPLLFKGANVQGEVIAPFATTEGALIASVSRGVLALNAAGGVVTSSGPQRCNRSPCLVTESFQQAVTLGEWVKHQVARMQEEVVSKHTKHGKLVEIVPVYDKEVLHLIFRYETGDASGQNMTSTCTGHCLTWIVARTEDELPPGAVKVKFTAVESSLSGDKRSSCINSTIGRGIPVCAEVFLSNEVLSKYLKVKADDLVLLIDYVCQRAASRSTQFGFNANCVNTLAAMFTATGQDIACVTESSFAHFGIRRCPDGSGVIASYFMPSLVVATVGGGTNLPTQAECLEMMGCHGTGKVRRLAEIIAAYCLALDLSTTSAVASSQFTQAHDRLGKNRPTESKL